MSNPAHLLEPEVAAAALAIADARHARHARRGDAVLPGMLYDEAVEDARAALAAAQAAAGSASVAPRRAGALRAADAELLRLETRAATVLILTRDRDGRAWAALSAVAAGESLVGHDEGAQDLWSAIATRMAASSAESPSVPAEPEHRP